MAIPGNPGGEAIEAAVEIGAFFGGEGATRTAVLGFERHQSAEFAAQFDRLCARERAIAHTFVDSRIDLRLPLIDGNPCALLLVVTLDADAEAQKVKPPIEVCALPSAQAAA